MNEQKEDLFTTYEVDSVTRRCSNTKGKTAEQILVAIKQAIDPALLSCLDYDTASDVEFDPTSRVIVYTVPGGSEGYYLHVDMIVRGTIKNLVLMKTCDWKPTAIQELERAVWNVVVRQ